MAKRTREVYPTDQIAHLWAHQTQRSARNPTGNFSFAGNELRSYSTIIAQRVEYKGKIAFLHLDNSWSNTTAKHQCHMRRASFGSTFLVQDFPRLNFYSTATAEEKKNANAAIRRQHNANIDSLVKQAEQFALKASRARTHGEWHTRSADRFLTMAKEYAAFFGIRRTFPAIDVAALAANAKARAERARKLESARAKAERERGEKIREMCAAEAPALMQQWRNTGAHWLEVSPALAELSGNRGASASNLQYYNGGSHLMRLEGENVQTNLNVRVPASHVRRLAPIALAAFHDPEVLAKLVGRHVGSFSIDGISSTDGAHTLIVGCHRFSAAEISLILDQLQRAEIVPAEETATA